MAGLMASVWCTLAKFLQRSPGDMFCWGNTVNGELGLGGIEEENILSPRELSFAKSTSVLQVACGWHHSVMVTDNGQVYSCGSNDFGQLGHEKTRKKPEMIDALSAYVIIGASCGANHSLAVNEWGQLFSWGSDSHGQLGMSQEMDVQPKPKIVKGLATCHVIQITCGLNHCLALTNRRYSSVERKPTLIRSLRGIPIAHIACGGSHSLAVSKSGAVFGWGKNEYGQLGLNDNSNRVFPCQLKTLRSIKVKYITCGEDFSVFLTKDGGVFTCGAGMYGQLGHGTTTNELLPRKIMELMGSIVSQITCGRRHTLALVPSRGRIYGFGLGGAGQLGTRVARNATTPQVVLGPWVSPSGSSVVKAEIPSKHAKNCVVKRIFAGGDHCFAVVTRQEDHVNPDDCREFVPKTQILIFTVSDANKCARLPPNESVDQDFMTYIETVFSSQACINSSFLLDNDEHYCCTSRHHGINLSTAEQCFSSLGKVENSSIKDLIFSCVKEHLLPSLSPSPPDVETLRVYMTLPFYIEFENPRNYEILHNPFGRAVLALKSEAARIVGLWWRKAPIDYFERLIRIFKDVVVYLLWHCDKDREINRVSARSDRQNPNLFVPLEILGHLHKLNNIDLKVPYETFCLPELTEKIDIRVDYVHWLSESIQRPTQMQSAMNQAASQALRNILFAPYAGPVSAFLELTVSRENIVADTVRELSKYDKNDLKKPLKLLRIKNILKAMKLHFAAGLLCGLAIYNFTIIDLPFPLALYKKLLKQKVTLQDLSGLSPALARSLQELLDYEGTDEESVFCLTFEISREVFGEVKIHELKPNGGRIPVSHENKQEFVDLYVDFILNSGVEKHFMAFNNGFHKVCGGKVLELFHAHELMAVVVGNENYDWEELERNAEYKNGYTENDKVIRNFWEVFHELPLEQKKKFLQFLTGSDRIPIQGMKSIKIFFQPTPDEKYLPVAHTCFNLLDLPRYRTKERLKYKLLQAIQQTEIFALV
ncbi:E3 ubiquitin-protein ligase Smurf1 [Gryllus bimaculatus]|nr:E3 ubiquitin-protein ligase Smurf1 [Gryllus bimaculatus]